MLHKVECRAGITCNSYFGLRARIVQYSNFQIGIPSRISAGLSLSYISFGQISFPQYTRREDPIKTRNISQIKCPSEQEGESAMLWEAKRDLETFWYVKWIVFFKIQLSVLWHKRGYSLSVAQKHFFEHSWVEESWWHAFLPPRNEEEEEWTYLSLWGIILSFFFYPTKWRKILKSGTFRPIMQPFPW